MLPLLVYGGIAAAILIPEDKSIVAKFFINWGEGYIEGNWLVFIATLAAIAAMWFINRKHGNSGRNCFQFITQLYGGI